MAEKRKGNIPIIIFLSILILVLIGGFVYCLQNLFTSNEVEGYTQQVREEEYLNAFIEDVENDRLETMDEVEVTYENSRLDYTDDAYPTFNGRKYTPENARGRIECILEIPKIKLRRGVYTGTIEDILWNLDLWMTTVANPDEILGQTKYIIYGHNAVSQELSFNRLQEVVVGDYFILTANDAVYLYDVTDFFAIWRELFTWDYVDNENIGKNKCYIATCGRGQYRYKDIVVEGTLRKKYTLSEWEKEKGEITADRVETIKKVEDTRPQMDLVVEMIGTDVHVTLNDPTGHPAQGEKIVVTDTDGIFLYENDETGEPITYETDENGQVTFPIEDLEKDTEYVIGTFDFKSDKYRSPSDVSFTLKSTIKESVIETKVVKEEAPQADKYFYIWIILISLSGILILLSVIMLIKMICEEVKVRRRLERKI